MEKTNSLCVSLLALFSCFFLQPCTALDTITPSKSIKDPQFIISQDGVFRLAFFGFANSSNRYVGILYHQMPVQTVVWVANRNKPLKDSTGILKISDDGNLVVLNGISEILWSSNVTDILFPNKTIAQLLDSGNLVLYDDGDSGRSLWQSFEHPSNSFIETMKIGTDLKTGRKVQLNSWRSPYDPADGNFSLSLEPFNIPEFTIWNNNQLYYRSGPWNGRIFIGTNITSYHDNFDHVADHQLHNYYIEFMPLNSTLVYCEFNSQGKLIERHWDAGKGEWEKRYHSILQNDCDVYGKCGTFGVCDSTKQPICSCSKGFEPKNREEWRRGNWSSGCFRTTLLQCQRDDNNGQRKDGFLKMEMMKVPAFPVQSSIIYGNCVDQCLKNCSCVAYAYDGGIGCMFWNADLIDLQKFPDQNPYVRSGGDFFLRLSYSELDEKKGKRRVVAISAVIVGIIISTVSALFLWRWMANRRGNKQKRKQIKLLFNKGNEMAKFYGDEVGEDSAQVKLLQQLPLFDFEELATATNNFDHTKKLGRGGFGIVYRGTLDDGKEIAVKRLSKASGQGLEEFTNEVVVISKLQHKNLVKLLGCCVEEEEKMLI